MWLAYLMTPNYTWVNCADNNPIRHTYPTQKKGLLPTRFGSRQVKTLFKIINGYLMVLEALATFKVVHPSAVALAIIPALYALGAETVA